MTEKTEKRVADTINIVTYVANDGTEFVSKDSCLAYEKKLEEIEKREREVDKRLILDAFESKISYKCIGNSFVNEKEFYICKLESEADYEAFMKWQKYNAENNLWGRYLEEYLEKPEVFPCRFMFIIDWDCEYIESLNSNSFDWAREIIAEIDKK